MALSILFNDAIDSFHSQILMEIVITNVSGSILDIKEHSILESLYNISVALTGTAPKLNTVSHDR
jgi:hypothetical protein